MHRNRTVQRLAAGWSAMVCALALAVPASASVADVPASPPADLRCCAPASAAAAGAPLAERGEHVVAVQSLQVAQQSNTGGAGNGSATEGGNDEEATRQKTPDPAKADADPFRGSAEPAGPDLTVDEERDLISRGWN